ncbi:hypothetical protein C8R45DRAFT_524257, partial [Mycena sanguinolenta]
MIPMGDIDLRRQIRVNEYTGVAYSYPQRACVRRMHSAKARIDGQKSRVTVAMYQGDDAEEEWRQDIAKHMSLRHPNIVQICGAASSNGIHATLFNDDLIPLREVLDRHRASRVFTVYIYACCNQDFSEAYHYIYSAFQRGLSPGYTRWIRRSTGRLCTELTLTHDGLPIHLNSPEIPGPSRLHSVSTLSTEAITTFIDSLTLEQYHSICAGNLRQYEYFDLSPSTTVNLRAVFHCPSHPLEDSVEIAFLPSAEAGWPGNWTISRGGTGEVMPNGWTRFQSGNVFNNTLPIYFSVYRPSYWDTWLSQANHIFRHLHIMSNFEDYVIVDNILFNLNILPITGEPPEAFLFLCPPEGCRTSPSSFRWPACPAYWSLDPSGVHRLSPEDATQLGFPPIEFSIKGFGCSWDTSVYEGLRQFHQAKGFDPFNQDVARHLRRPLWQLSSQRDAPWACGDEDFDADIDSDCNSAYIDNDELEYPLTSACDASDVDTESSHSQETVHETVSRNANCKNDASESTVDEDVAGQLDRPLYHLTSHGHAHVGGVEGWDGLLVESPYFISPYVLYDTPV